MLCVFVDEDAKLSAKHLQGDVHDAFCVAVLDFEAAALFVGEGDDGGIPVVQDFHVDVEQVALQPQSAFGSGPEDVAVYLVLIDSVGKEATDVLVDDGAIGVEGEGSCVAHHGAIEACGFLE